MIVEIMAPMVTRMKYYEIKEKQIEEVELW